MVCTEDRKVRAALWPAGNLQGLAVTRTATA
jgi:hypothetical protein